MPQPVAHIETLAPPADYTPAQISYALMIAVRLDRGKLLLLEPPANAS